MRTVGQLGLHLYNNVIVTVEIMEHLHKFLKDQVGENGFVFFFNAFGISFIFSSED